MKEKVIEIILSDLFLPVVVSVVCFLVQYKITRRSERKKKFPSMDILELDSRNKVRLNKEIIKASGVIIEFGYHRYETIDDYMAQPSRSSIRFEKITYEKLEKKAECKKIVFMGFPNSVDTDLCLTHIVDGKGRFNEIDKQVVPVFISDKTKYCFICMEEDKPAEIQGKAEGNSVSYYMRGVKEGSICPKLTK